MSFLKAFSFKNLGHYIAVAARDIVKAAPVIEKDLQIVGSVVSIVDPAAAPAIMEIERASNAAFGYVVDASQHVVAVADGTNTLTIQGLTSAEVEDFQQFAAYFKSHAYANGVALPPSPAPVPNAPPAAATATAVKVAATDAPLNVAG
jgi:hypothetical protein